MNIVYLRKKWLKITLVTLTIFIGFSFASLDSQHLTGFIQFVFGITNPATTYCQDLGYEWMIEKTEEGEIGMCKFPDGTTVEDWDFLKGKSAQEWSYCEQKGYALKTISDPDKCSSVYSEDCVVCILTEGVELEASKLLEFEIQRESCGNKICDSGENLRNCPQDCLYKERHPLLYIGILFVVILLGVLIYMAIKNWRKKRTIKLTSKL